MEKTILIIGTLDTKAKELAYLRKRIEAEGVKSLLMDVSCKSEPSASFSDVPCETVANKVGKDFGEITQLAQCDLQLYRNRNQITPIR